MARNTTRTTRSYLAGIGASGALLACALVGFLSLLGAVSVSVWPEPDGSGALEVVELQAPPSAPADLSAAEGLVASADLVPSAPAPRPDRGGADRPDSGDGAPSPGEPQRKPPDDAPTPDDADEPPAPQPPSGGGRELDEDENEHDQGDGGDEGREPRGDGHGGDGCEEDDLIGGGEHGEWDGRRGGDDGDRGWDEDVEYVDPDEVSTDVWNRPHHD